MKLFIAAQNVATHCEFDRGKRDEKAVTVAELKRTVGEKAKVEEELEQMRGRLEEEGKRNAELSSLMGKLWDERRRLSRELSTVQKNLDEEKLAAQRVEGHFNLIEKVGEKYPSLDWSFLGDEGDENEAEQGGV
ncbi:uncharacterized protein Pyn_41192 [Prunus yedoensis var. nudiflora]|uniref:Uncharacterized protein n=1 Tax=Prunus yedoensis var. nudiflora TaxID=2094558 RepID=A0A314YE33_PRUYE|nr:uncharacterized protein Pyn_41192 [Prunus yedoensis var. nudiflora]